jgi:hypothetical protein
LDEIHELLERHPATSACRVVVGAGCHEHWHMAVADDGDRHTPEHEPATNGNHAFAGGNESAAWRY